MENNLINFPELMNIFYEKSSEDQQNFGQKLSEACDCLKQICETYPPNEVALSFNGGKDCTVILHILSRLFSPDFL